MTKRIRTTSQAKRLRPVAIERARQGKIRVGDVVFYGGIAYANVTVFWLYDHKPYKQAMFRSVRNGSMFIGSLAHVRRV